MNGTNSRLDLSTSEVGSLLGVHPSTVKRWSDQGTLRVTRTKGGHRRFHLRDVLSGARSEGIPTFLDPFHPWEANVWLALQAGRADGDFSGVISLGLSWLRQGDTDLLGRFFFEIARQGEVPFPVFLDQAIRGFMARVGDEWEEGRLQVGEEHMASEVVNEAFIRLRLAREGSEVPKREVNPPPRVAVVGSAEGDHHDLGAQAVRAVLEREGWKVYYLGGNVPVEDFARIQQAQLADLVCISFHAGSTLTDLRRSLETLARYYGERTPYSLALGGSLNGVRRADLPDGPFLGFSISGSAAEFSSWLENEFPQPSSDPVGRNS